VGDCTGVSSGSGPGGSRYNRGVIVPTLAIVLVLGCAVAFSGADICRKLLASWVRPVPMLFGLAGGMAPFFLAWHVLADGLPPSAGYWLPGLASTLLNVGANLAFIEAVRRSPLSLTIPFLSLTPVFTSILAIPLLHEAPSPRQWVGIALVVVGAFWLNLGRDAPSPRLAWQAFLREPGSRLMVGVALLWSLAMPLDKLAVMQSSPTFHGIVLSLGVALALVILALGRGRLDEFRDLRHRPGLLVAGVLVSVGALALQLVAIKLVWVGFVETMKRSVGSFLALLWGRLIFDEALEPQRFVAVSVMGIGVALILL
jgi:drug/metabolite transporter (DMT)-like permease